MACLWAKSVNARHRVREDHPLIFSVAILCVNPLHGYGRISELLHFVRHLLPPIFQ